MPTRKDVHLSLQTACNGSVCAGTQVVLSALSSVHNPSYGNTLLQIRVPVSRKVLKTSRDGDHTTSKQSVILPDCHHREKVFLSIKSYPALLQLVPVVSHSPSIHGGRVHINPSKLSAESLSSYFAINQ